MSDNALAQCITKHFTYDIIRLTGDDRLRRKRLVPDCEPRGADLEKSAQNFKVPTALNMLLFLSLPNAVSD